MDNASKIKECYQASKNYPDLAQRLQKIGVESYTVDVASHTILYRFAEGVNVLHPLTVDRTISGTFDKEKTIAAIRNNQQGKTDYPTFMNEIADSGVRFYEATLIGMNRRVMYVGFGGFYEEQILWL